MLGLDATWACPDGDRYGLAVAGDVTQATGTAEREAALALIDNHRPAGQRITLGADKAQQHPASQRKVIGRQKEAYADGTQGNGTRESHCSLSTSIAPEKVIRDAMERGLLGPSLSESYRDLRSACT